MSDYPLCPPGDLVETLHGHAVADPYRWLEDPQAPATKDWSAAQDDLFAAEAAGFGSRDWFADRVREHLDCGAESVPVWRGERRFFTRRGPGQEHPVLLLAEGGEQRVLIDPAALDPAGTTTLDSWVPDPAGRLLAYQLSTGGDEEAQLYVRDVDSGEVLDGPIDRCRTSPIAWLADRPAFYYVRRLPRDRVPEGEASYHRRLYLHTVGADAEADAEVFGAGRDKTEYYGMRVSRDGRWLTVTAAPGTAPRNDAWIADLAAGAPESPDLVPIQEGVDAECLPYVGPDGRLYLFTDRDSPYGRLCATDPAAPALADAATLIPEDPEAVLTGYTVIDGPGITPRLLVLRRRHAVSELTEHDLAQGTLRAAVPLPGLGTVTGLRAHPDGGTDAWLSYTDHLTPPTVYRYDARTGRLEAWARPPRTPEPPEVRVEQHAFASSDGATVRMLVLSPAGADGPLPTIAYGYGGFGISMTPGFSATALAWVAAGGRYAVVNLRGGLEEGERWHRAGMRGAKQQVFDDFHAAAEHLAARGLTTPAQLAAMGGSNGGLLVGAAVTQRPEAYAAAVCSAPLLDMVRYEKFGLGQLWSVEYGSAEDPDALGWLLDYSPYHAVRPGTAYPAVLFTVFDNDSRVDPMHARKMCAALQAATSRPRGQAPILLRREAEVGHSTRSVSRSAALSGDCLAFLARHTGLRRAAGARFVHRCQVRYADLDPQNHVNNVRMLTYLEDARIAMLRWDSAGGEEPAGGPMVVASQRADYLKPLALRGEPVRVEVWVSELRRASVTLHYEVRDDDTVYLRASTVLAGFDPETQRARRFSDAERRLFGRYIERPED